VTAVGDREPVNILLVDDQPGKLLSYEAILSDAGESLICAGSGREALEKLLEHEIALVLMDVSMPDLDGFELARLIREHPRFERTAIIFVSAIHFTDFDRMRGYAAGAVDYVSVPVVPEILKAKVGVFVELFRKRKELEQLTAGLERRVAERTAELEVAAAAQADLMCRLREADRRKDEFLAVLAHELRNPLAPLLHAVEILRTAERGGDLSWCREVIGRQVDQLRRLVDDLMDVSRVTQGKLALREELVDLAEVVTEAVEISRPLLDHRAHRLTVGVPVGPLWVSGDRVRLTQVLANLLNNAAKFQEEGGHVEISVARVGTEWVVAVQDRGVGIEPDKLPVVFDLFSQVESTLDRSHGGLGIGLALVQRIVEMHGGSVRADSGGRGQGSQFTVRLNRAEPRAARKSPTVQRDPVKRAGPPRRVLLVDDNRDASESLAMLLTTTGHEVATAGDGPRAIEILGQYEPDMILLDIGLPGMDGYEVCRRIRREGLSSASIIAMTGFGQDRDRELAKAAGFDAHLVKPVAIGRLLSILDALPERPAVGAEAAPPSA